MEKPKIGSAGEWQRFNNGYAFDTPAGTRTLLDLFEGRGQLVAYQFMDNGPDGYPGCTGFTSEDAQVRLGTRLRPWRG